MLQISELLILSGSFKVRTVLFFTNALPVFSTIRHTLAVDSILRLNVVFKVSGQEHDLSKHVVFPNQYTGLDRQYLECVPWLNVSSYV